MSLKEVVALAIHVLQETKEHVDGCGGGSEFLLLDQGGVNPIGVHWMDIQVGEPLAQSFKNAVRMLFPVVLNPDSSNEEIEKAITLFSTAIRVAQDQAKGRKAYWKELLDALETGLKQ